MRFANGYGTVYKLSGNRRKPWIVRKTTGWNDKGIQLYETIGYYETRQLGIQALIEYNKNPYSIESKVTFQELYDTWKEGKFENVSQSAINGYKASFKLSKNLHNIKFVEIKTKHMQDIIRTCGKGHGTKRKIKSLFNQLFKFAMENDIVSKDYSNYVEVGKNTENNKRQIFTSKEIKQLFEIVNVIEYVDTILIMIYSGLRIGELLEIKICDVDLDNRTIIGGIKTDAGKDRIIPISIKILDLIKNRVNNGNEYLVSRPNGKQFKYDNYYREKFTPIMEQLNMNHKPHDCRHTFATLMNKAGADTISLQKIIGHASYQTTANIYTHTDIEQLKNAIDLL